MSRTITARYHGQPSLGYKPGHTYQLRIRQNLRWVYIERVDGSGQCPYSPVGFAANWTPLLANQDTRKDNRSTWPG